MEFFNNVKKSIYSPDYYQEVLARPFSYSLRYFFLLVTVVALLATIVISFSVLPKITSFLNMVDEKVLQYYPDELEIVIEKGKASTNVQEPYFIKVPADWEQDDKVKPAGMENILVIDTKAPFSLENFKNYKTACLLTEDSLACYDDNQAVKITPLTQMPNFKINEAVVSSFLNKVQPFLKLAYPIFILVFFLVFFVSSAARLIYLLIGALLIWLVAKIKKVGIGYKKSYQIGLHLMTLPLIAGFLINHLLTLFGIRIDPPYLFTIILVLAAFVNLKPKTTIENPTASNIISS